MIEEVAPKIFKIEIPIPIPFLDSVNAYVVKGEDRALLVDTGMGRPVCMEAMRSALGELGVDLEETDFFITHHHGDHFGLLPGLLTDRSRVFISEREEGQIRRITTGKILDDVAHFIVITGFPESDLSKLIPSGTGVEYTARNAWPFRFVHDGDVVEAGPYRFVCLQTPGHSAGHMCLYDSTARILFSGDHVLHGITPGIQLRSDRENPLQEYIDSLDRLIRLDVGLVLPGHGAVFANYRERIGEIVEHHRKRALEIVDTLSGEARNPYEVASRITWSVVDCEGWEGLPLVQQFFATGEAFSHLKFLEERGQVRKTRAGELLRYQGSIMNH
jgi:glyoxylase-like metal-dependent hydrolase (beta-lactamase superfamily II)